MKKLLGLIAIIAMAILIVPMFASIHSVRAAGQPPIIAGTFWEGTIGWGPYDADPAVAYDTASGEILFQSYQGLLSFKGEQYYQFTPTLATNEPTLQVHTMTVTNASNVGADPTGTTWTDVALTTYTLIGWRDEKYDGFHEGDVIYLTDGTTWLTWTVDSMTTGLTVTLHLWRGSYVFNIRNGTFVNATNVNFGNPVGSTWVEEFTGDVYTVTGWEHSTGTLSIGDNLTVTGPGLWRHLTLNFEIEITPNDPSPGITEVEITACIYFYDKTGNFVDNFDVYDAEYSFEWGEVIDPPGYPYWMFDKPLFDAPDHTIFDNSTAMDLAHLIDDAIVPDAGSDTGVETPPTLTINIGCHFPDNAFKQILSNSWSYIQSKERAISLLGWDGDLFAPSDNPAVPLWWVVWAGEGSGIDFAVLDPLDQMTEDSYAGTGPFHVSEVDAVNLHVILQKNPDYWQGWPAPGSNSSIDTLEIDYIASWPTRRAAFEAGSIDTCAVPRSNMFDMLDNTTKEPALPQITAIKEITPTLTVDAVMFSFILSNATVYAGDQQLGPSGIPLNFFNNTYVRRAFAYSFNWSTFGAQAYYGESEYRANPLVVGLYPDYYNTTIPTYYESLNNAKLALQAAMFWNGTGYQSIWSTGFLVVAAYNSGNAPREIAATMMSNFFRDLSTYAGRNIPGHDFTVTVTAVLWSGFYSRLYAHLIPLAFIGWLADFADADNFIRPYMHSSGPYSYAQSYSANNGWGITKDVLMDQAVLTPDGPARKALYQQLQMIYYNDCPSFPMNNPRGRRWCQYWVKGYYYDAIYPSTYYYTIWKEDNCWYDVSGIDAHGLGTGGISDGVCNMKDIAYYIAHFNAHAPVPGLATDPKWVGNYGANGAVDSYGDRVSNMKDIAGAIQHFNHKINTGKP